MKSLRMDVEKPQEVWPIRSRNRASSDVGAKQRVPESTEKKQRMSERVSERMESSTDDDSFELGAVTVSDDIFYPG